MLPVCRMRFAGSVLTLKNVVSRDRISEDAGNGKVPRAVVRRRGRSFSHVGEGWALLAQVRERPYFLGGIPGGFPACSAGQWSGPWQRQRETVHFFRGIPDQLTTKRPTRLPRSRERPSSRETEAATAVLVS